MRRLRSPLIGFFLVLASFYSIGVCLSRPLGLDPVQVTSEPAGATVIVDGQVEGTTPMMIYLSTSVAHSIRLEHAGYLATETVVEPVLRWGMLTRFLFGHPVASAAQTTVEVATGHTRRLSPSTVELFLQQRAQAEYMPRVVTQAIWPDH